MSNELPKGKPGRRSSIRPELHEKILRLAGEGLMAPAIAQTLAAEDNCKAKPQSIQKFLWKYRQEREPAARAAAMAATAEYVTSDLERLGELMVEAREIYKAARSDNDLRAAIAALKTEGELIERRQKFSGAAGETGETFADLVLAAQRLRESAGAHAGPLESVESGLTAAE